MQIKNNSMEKAKKPTMQKKSLGNELNKTSNVVAISIFLAILISAAAYYLMIKPQLDRVGPGKELDVAAVTQDLEEQKRLHADLKLLEENFNKIDPANIELLSTVLPSEESLPELLSQLEMMANSAGLDLKRVSITEVEAQAVSARQRLQQEVDGAQAAPTTKGLKEVVIQMELDAFTYSSFKSFVKLLETHRRLIDIETFSFQTDNDTQRVQAKTYYLEG